MFYTGWPIHRTGWLALSHRTAEMNSLITLGTIAAYGLQPGGDVASADAREVYFGGRRGDLDPDPARATAETKAKAGTREGSARSVGLGPALHVSIRDKVESEVAIEDVALGDVDIVTRQRSSRWTGRIEGRSPG